MKIIKDPLYRNRGELNYRIILQKYTIIFRQFRRKRVFFNLSLIFANNHNADFKSLHAVKIYMAEARNYIP